MKTMEQAKIEIDSQMKRFGKVNSLNASVATGIAVYEVVRQRINK